MEEREKELRDLQRQVEIVRKRIRELDVETVADGAQAASQGQEKRPQRLPTTESLSEPGFDNPNSPTSQAAAGNHIVDSHDALPYDLIASTNSLEALPSSSHSRIVDPASTGFVGKVSNLLYYRELDGDVVVGSRLLKNMDLVQLRHLAVNGEKEQVNSDTEDDKHMGCVYYAIFLKTEAVEDLERALNRTKEQMPIKIDNPLYTSYLKSFIVMLVKKYQHTRSQDDLQEAIFRAQEMVAATSPDHPDRWFRIYDWIKMMFTKFCRTGLQDDLDEITTTVQEAGVNVYIDNADGGGFTVKVGMPEYVYQC